LGDRFGANNRPRLLRGSANVAELHHLDLHRHEAIVVQNDLFCAQTQLVDAEKYRIVLHKPLPH